LLYFLDILVLLAIGGEGNQSQIQLGYGSCIWGTGRRVTTCPPGPGATQRSSAAGIASDQDELHQSGSHGEDVTQSPPVPGQRGQSADETEVVIRSQWRASAEEPGEGVTQLAAHGIADGKSLSQFWRAGDVGSIQSTAGLPISMAEFDNRRTVTLRQSYNYFTIMPKLRSI